MNVSLSGEVPSATGGATVGSYSGSAVTVQIAQTIVDVEAMRESWTAWNHDRDSDLDFCLESVWAGDQFIRPYVISIYRNGLLDAMWVGRLERSRTNLQIGYFRLPGIPARLLTFSQGGLLGNQSPENSELFLKAIIDTLRGGEADQAVLQHIRMDSSLFHKALSLPSYATRDHVIKAESHNVMALPGSVEELYRGFSQGLRAEVRRKKRKILAEFGESTEISCHRHAEELEVVTPWVEEIAKTTYQRGLGVGFQDTEQMRQRLRFYANKGWLRIYILKMAGKPRAFWIGTLYNQLFVSDYNAYDPEFRDYSIGTYLLTAVVEEFCKEGVKVVDFGSGQAEYKERFGNSRSSEASVHVFAPNLKGILLNTAQTTTGLCDVAIRKLLERTNILPKVKKIWRNRLASRSAAK